MAHPPACVYFRPRRWSFEVDATRRWFIRLSPGSSAVLTYRAMCSQCTLSGSRRQNGHSAAGTGSPCTESEEVDITALRNTTQCMWVNSLHTARQKGSVALDTVFAKRTHLCTSYRFSFLIGPCFRSRARPSKVNGSDAWWIFNHT